VHQSGHFPSHRCGQFFHQHQHQSPPFHGTYQITSDEASARRTIHYADGYRRDPRPPYGSSRLCQIRRFRNPRPIPRGGTSHTVNRGPRGGRAHARVCTPSSLNTSSSAGQRRRRPPKTAVRPPRPRQGETNVPGSGGRACLDTSGPSRPSRSCVTAYNSAGDPPPRTSWSGWPPSASEATLK